MEWWLVAAGGGVVAWRLHQIMPVRIVFGGTCNDSKLELRRDTPRPPLSWSAMCANHWFINRNGCRMCGFQLRMHAARTNLCFCIEIARRCVVELHFPIETHRVATLLIAILKGLGAAKSTDSLPQSSAPA